MKEIKISVNLFKKAGMFMAGFSLFQCLRIALTASSFALNRFAIPRRNVDIFITKIHNAMEVAIFLGILVMTLYVLLVPRRYARFNSLVSIGTNWLVCLLFFVVLYAYAGHGKRGDLTTYYWGLVFSGFAMGLNQSIVMAVSVKNISYFAGAIPFAGVQVSLYHILFLYRNKGRPGYDVNYWILVYQIIIAIVISGTAAIFWTIGFLEDHKLDPEGAQAQPVGQAQHSGALRAAKGPDDGGGQARATPKEAPKEAGARVEKRESWRKRLSASLGRLANRSARKRTFRVTRIRSNDEMEGDWVTGVIGTDPEATPSCADNGSAQQVVSISVEDSVAPEHIVAEQIVADNVARVNVGPEDIVPELIGEDKGGQKSPSSVTKAGPTSPGDNLPKVGLKGGVEGSVEVRVKEGVEGAKGLRRMEEFDLEAGESIPLGKRGLRMLARRSTSIFRQRRSGGALAGARAFLVALGNAASPVLMSSLAMGLVYLVFPAIAPYRLTNLVTAHKIDLAILLTFVAPALINIALCAFKLGPDCDWSERRYWHYTWVFAVPYLACIALFFVPIHYPQARLSRLLTTSPCVLTLVCFLFALSHAVLKTVGFTGAGVQNTGRRRRAHSFSNSHNSAIAPGREEVDSSRNGQVSSFNILVSYFFLVLFAFLGDGYIKTVKMFERNRDFWPTAEMSALRSLRFWVGRAFWRGYRSFGEVFTTDIREQLMA